MSGDVQVLPGGEAIPFDAMSLKQAQRHVELIAGSPDAEVFFRFIHDSDRSAPAIPVKGTVAQLWSGIQARQAQGYGVFFVVNEGGGRAKEITRIRAAFVDADGIPEPVDWHVAPDFMVRRDELHWHAYWPLKGLPVEEFRDAQQRLRAKYGTDRSVCDRSRVMRLAGTLHLKKPDEPYTVALDESCADPSRVGLDPTGLLEGLPEITRAEPTSSPLSGLPLPPAEIVARLACCDPDCAYPDWRDLAGALHATPCTDPEFDKRHAFARWSRGGNKFESDEDCGDVYDTMPPKDGGLGAGSFIHLTNANGYRGPTAGKNDQTSEEVFGPLIAGWEAEGARESAVPVHSDRPRVILRDEAAQNARKPTSWLVENLLPDGGTVAIRAPFNSFKSFIATDLALAVASGHRAFNALAVRRSGPVVYMLGEGVAGFETQRRPAWREARGIEPGRVLPIYTIEGVPQVRSVEDVTAYLDAMAALPSRPVLVIIDTTARAMAGLNENEAGDAGLYLAAVELIARRLGCCAVSIMHEGKDAARGARGSSAFEAGFENVWRMEADPDLLTAKIVPVKLKDDAGIDPVFLQGRQLALPNGKGSLVFDRVGRDDYQRAAGKRTGITPGEVGAALKKLNAVGGETVTTHVLAIEIAGPGADRKLIAAKEHYLRGAAHGRFRAYVAHQGSGRGDSTLWTFTVDEEAGDDA
jgi:hypothetical protein